MKPRHDSAGTKVDALLEEGTLNPSAEKVRDPKFLQEEFFDPRDVVQVKYEMLRRVRLENASVAQAAKEYGVSRPTFYHARADFQEGGIAGLVPRKRGPCGPRKVRGELLTFLKRHVTPGQPIRARALAAVVQRQFGVDLHPRTIERAVGGKKTPRQA
jgi:transposase